MGQSAIGGYANVGGHVDEQLGQLYELMKAIQKQNEEGSGEDSGSS